MRQQNVTGYELVSGDLGRVIGAGEKFDHPVLITGCISLDDKAAKDASAPQGEPEDKPRTKGARQ